MVLCDILLEHRPLDDELLIKLPELKDSIVSAKGNQKNRRKKKPNYYGRKTQRGEIATRDRMISNPSSAIRPNGEKTFRGERFF
jgi:hypothetical protein